MKSREQLIRSEFYLEEELPEPDPQPLPPERKLTRRELLAEALEETGALAGTLGAIDVVYEAQQERPKLINANSITGGVLMLGGSGLVLLADRLKRRSGANTTNDSEVA